MKYIFKMMTFDVEMPLLCTLMILFVHEMYIIM